jgi:hypothetical protein
MQLPLYLSLAPFTYPKLHIFISDRTIKFICLMTHSAINAQFNLYIPKYGLVAEVLMQIISITLSTQYNPDTK